jgi:hypothetical protein
MRPSTRHTLRTDPRLVYAVHASRDSGLTVAEIAAKHSLALPVVLGFLRSPADSCSLLGPYEFQRAPLTANTAVHVYWLGYIAACGRLFGQNQRGTLVLAIHPDDAGQVETLVQDLIVGHATCEFADSSLNGRQAYIRNPGLARILLQWGMAETPEEGSVSLEYVPPALISDFLRGYLEGSRLTPPFGGDSRRAVSPGTPRSLTVVGSPELIQGLRAALRSGCGVSGGVISSHERSGLAQLTFTAEESRRLLACAYRAPVRSVPRAAKFVAQFSRESRTSGRVSDELPVPR